MISFKPSDEELAFVELAKDFARGKIRPFAVETEDNRIVNREITSKLKELGFTTLELPESWGGLELSLVSQVQIYEALSYGDLATVQGLPGINEASSFIRLDPNNPVFTSFKETHQSGNWPIVSFLVNRNTNKQQTLAIEKIGKGYKVTGNSIPVKMGALADYVLIAGEDENREFILLWLENKSQNFWNKQIGDYRLGLLASQCARLQFEGVQVSEQQVLAVGERARRILNESLARIRVLEAAKEVGTMGAALAYATEYTAQRKAFGKEIAKFQGVSFTIAQMAMQTQAARNLVLQAAYKLDEQVSGANQSSLNALHFTHRAIRFVTDSAVQLLGGHGYVQDHPVEKWMRDAQAQVNLFETEAELLAKSGEYLLYEDERGMKDGIIRAVSTPKSS
jgi:acyl-CoA dehydrogenase